MFAARPSGLSALTITFGIISEPSSAARRISPPPPDALAIVKYAASPLTTTSRADIASADPISSALPGVIGAAFTAPRVCCIGVASNRPRLVQMTSFAESAIELGLCCPAACATGFVGGLDEGSAPTDDQGPHVGVRTCLSGQPGLSGAATIPRTFSPRIRQTASGRTSVEPSVARRKPAGLSASSATKHPLSPHIPLVSARIARFRSPALGSIAIEQTSGFCAASSLSGLARKTGVWSAPPSMHPTTSKQVPVPPPNTSPSS